MTEIYITSQKLCDTLKISSSELIALQVFIDSDPNDEWDLKEGTDYKVVNSSGLREYTCAGAFAVAECLEFKKKAQQNWFQNLIQNLIDAIKGHVQKAFVREHIFNNSSSLVQNNNRFFLSKADVVAIFRSRGDYVQKMSVEAQRLEKPLIQGEDYLDIPDKGIYYSLSGMMKLAHAYKINITRRHRKDWCTDVGREVEPCIADILKQIKAKNQAIASAVNQAKSKASHTCQVTGNKGNNINPIPMAGHHLYSKAEYPHLVATVDNIICITVEVHNHFHQFMGGFLKPCTLDDFERFVRQYHPENTAVLFWLQDKRLILGNQQHIKNRERSVLHLPWPIPKLLPPGL
jgi:hypothetical protein